VSIKDFTYKIPGGRVGVLLIHGLGGTPTEMRFVANGLARSGYTVHCLQMAGHGGSEEDLKDSTWKDWFKSVEEALFEVRQTCDVVFAGGLSTGAVLSLLLAARHPFEVNGTLLFAPTLTLNGWNIPWYAHLFRIIVHKKLANLINFPDVKPHGIKDERIQAFIAATMFSGEDASAGVANTPGGVVLEHRWLVQTLKRELNTISQPTLIVHPRDDDYADLNNAWYLQRHLAGMVEMTVLDDSYHVITIDRQRHDVVERATTFVERISSRLENAFGATVSELSPLGRDNVKDGKVAAA